MKKFILIILFTVFVPVLVFSTWIPKNSSSGVSYKCVFGFDKDGIAVGFNGETALTNDGGRSWSYPEFKVYGTAVKYHNKAVTINGSTYFAGGNSGIFSSTDMGQNWICIDSIKNINCIYFLPGDQTKGWAGSLTGTSVYKTTTSGSSWTSSGNITGASAIQSIYFEDANKGWAVCTNGVYYTGNGGGSWSEKYTGNCTSGCFKSGGNGLVTTNDGNIIKFVNGVGQKIIPPVYSGGSLNSVWVTDTYEGWAVGSGGKVFKTTNSGSSWAEDTDASGKTKGNNLMSVFFRDKDLGYIVGDGGTILKYTSKSRLPAPVLTYPVYKDSLDITAFDLKWNKVTDATSYRVSWAVTSDGLPAAYKNEAGDVSSYYFKDRSCFDYFWKVEAVYEPDEDLNSSAESYFFINCSARDNDIKTLHEMILDTNFKFERNPEWPVLKDDFDYTKWTGVKFYNDTGRVTELNLSNKGTIKGIPAAIGKLTGLTKLDLSYNQISTIPVEIGNLTKLETLDLSHNQLDTLPKELSDLNNLKELKLNDNKLIYDDFNANYTFYNKSYVTLQPQDSVGSTTLFNGKKGDTLTIFANCGNTPDNIYKWYENHQLLPSNTSKSLFLGPFDASVSSTYFCKITNSKIDSLTIKRKDVKVTTSGPAPTASFSIKPHTLDFGDTLINNSKESIISITNTGTAVGKIDSVRLEGDTVFSMNDTISNTVFAPNVSKNLELKFIPTQEKSYSAKLIFTSAYKFDNGNNSDTVIITGKGVNAKAYIQAEDAIFKQQIVNTRSDTLTLKISNLNATSVLKITDHKFGDSVGIAGSGKIFEVYDLPKNIDIAPGQSREFRVSFRPVSPIKYNSEILFTSNSEVVGSDNKTILSGEGVNGGFTVTPVINWDRRLVDPLNYKNCDTCFFKQYKADIVLVNNSPSSEVILTPTVLADSIKAEGFVDITDKPLATYMSKVTIPASGSVTINVYFHPKESGDYKMQIQFTSDANVNDTCTLTGIGVYPKFTTITNPLDFGKDIFVDSMKTGSVTFTNKNDNWKYSDNLIISGFSADNITYGGSGIFSFDTTNVNLPKTLKPGESLNLLCKFAPTAAGDFTAKLTTISNAAEEAVSTWTGTAKTEGWNVNIISSPANPVFFGKTENIKANITNSGSDVLKVTKLSITDNYGTVNNDFNILPPSTFDVVNGNPKEITIEFTPTVKYDNTMFWLKAETNLISKPADQASFTVSSYNSIQKTVDIIPNYEGYKPDTSKVINIETGKLLDFTVSIIDPSGIPYYVTELDVQLTFNPTIFYILPKIYSEGATLKLDKVGEGYIGKLRFKLSSGSNWIKTIETKTALGDSVLNILTFEKDPTAFTNPINFDAKEFTVKIAVCDKGGPRLIKNVNPALSKINIDPNPGSDAVKVTYTLSEECSPVFKCLDILGNEVLKFNGDIQKTGEQTTHLDVHSLQNGTYYIFVECSGYVLSKQFFISK